MRPKKSNEYTAAWVAPEFKRMLKADAAINGQSIFEYTRAQAQRRMSEMQLGKAYKNDETKKDKFRFGL